MAIDQRGCRELLRRVLADLGRGPDVAPPTPESDDPLAGFLSAAGQADLAFLRREATPVELDRLLDAGALPLVLWGATQALVVGQGPGGAELHFADGTTRPVPEGEAAIGLLALVGDPALLLVPVGVDPTFSVEDEAAPTPGSRLWQLLQRERRDIGLVYLYATLTGLLSLTLPLGVQAITGLVSGGLLLQPVIILIAFVVAGALLSGVLQVMQLSVVEVLQQRVFARLAFEFAFRIPRLRLEGLGGHHVPEVMNRFFESVIIQKSLAKLLTEATTAALQVIFGLILLTFYHPWFAAFALLLLVVLVWIFRTSGPRGIATSLAESAEKYATVHWLQEMGRSLTAFKFGGRSALPVERMDRHVTAYLHHRKAHFKVLVWQASAVVAFKTIVIGGLLILGSVLVLNRQITLGQFVASEIVIVTVLAGIEKLILSISTVYDILASVEKAGHVTDLPLERAGGRVLPGSGTATGMALHVSGLRYTYGDSEITALDGISLDVPAGQRVVITGADGAGQSTLLRVLSGLLLDWQGGYAIDGVPVRDLDLAAFRGDVGQLLSATDLFEGTIEENVRVGRPWITAQQVSEALVAVGAMEWVATQPHGTGSEIASGGAGLPAHLIHRLLLAQAIAGQPRLLVLDDFFQNLEAETRDRFVEVLMDGARPWTVLAISHDPVFLRAADRVLVLDDGRLVADGPLAEVRTHPILREIFAGEVL